MVLQLSEHVGKEGTGAGVGLGVGPLPTCHEHSVKKVLRSIELARKASACCEELKRAQEGVTATVAREGGLDVFSGLIQHCLAASAATLQWLVWRACATCPAGDVEAGSCLDACGEGGCSSQGLQQARAGAQAACANVSGAVMWAEMQMLNAFSRQPLAPAFVTLLAVLTSGIAVGDLSVASPHHSISGAHADDGSIVTDCRHLEFIEPAIFMRFFCAAAATTLLQQRTMLSAGALLGEWWQRQDQASWQRLLPRERLQVASSLLQLHKEPDSHSVSDARPQEDHVQSAQHSHRNPGLHHYADKGMPSERSGPTRLLIMHLPMMAAADDIDILAQEVLSALLLLSTHMSLGHLRVLWLESLEMAHAPRLMQRLLSAPAEIRMALQAVVEVRFGLDTRDEDLWSQMPSLMHCMCSGTMECWWLSLERLRYNEGQPRSSEVVTRLLSEVIEAFVQNAAPPQRAGVGRLHGGPERECIGTWPSASAHSRYADYPRTFLPWQPWTGYTQRHASAVHAIRNGQLRLGDASSKAIIWACHPSFPCGGHGDRIKGIVATFMLALATNRLFFVDAPDPWDLKLFMEPAVLDWRVHGLHLLPQGRHVLWDHDAFARSYLDYLLDADEPIWVVYTNKKSLLGPIFRHPRLAPAVSSMRMLETPHLTARVWHTLFRPVASLEASVRAIQERLGAQYLAMHHRSGDLSAGFGIVNGEEDRRSGHREVLNLLACAQFIEQQLGFPNTTRWYLATDNPAALEQPQVQAWMSTDKLLTNSRSTQMHIALAGVIPPTGARRLPEADSGAREASSDLAAGMRKSAEPSVQKDIESLLGVHDAWVDFLLISRSSAAVLSSSAFGIMAAQIGGMTATYSPSGCVRLDLMV